MCFQGKSRKERRAFMSNLSICHRVYRFRPFGKSTKQELMRRRYPINVMDLR